MSVTVLASSAHSLLALPVQKRSGVPVYIQLSDGLRSLILDRTLQPGAALPSSRIVCERYEITRMTLRQAYAVLAREGLVDSERGRGTFVTQPQHERNLPRMVGFSEEMRAAGHRPSSRVLAFRKTLPDPVAKNVFCLEERQCVWRIERLRMADENPLAIENVVLPEHLTPQLDSFDLATHSLYALLEGHFGHQLGHCDQTIAAKIPIRKEGKRLGISSRFAILEVTRRRSAKTGSRSHWAQRTIAGTCITLQCRQSAIAAAPCAESETA